MRKQKFVTMAGNWFARPFAKMVAFGGVTTAMLLGSLLAFSQIPGPDNGPTQTGSICMQKIYGTPVANSNRLNCTANDISLARAVSVFPDSCISGSTFDLQATFEVDVTANIRYDAGFFFRIDGGDNARGDGVNADGICSLSALEPGIPPAEELDGDSCGDLKSGTYNVTFTIPGVACVGVPDPDNPGQQVLKLPNCTSWHSNQGTVCDPITDAFDFNPDTKSKCVCDDDFTVPVRVEEATITVDKTAMPTMVNEPGGEVTYNVKVTNDAAFESVTITTVIDDIYGDLTDPNNPNLTENLTCPSLVGVTLGPGAMTSCSFKAFVAGDADDDAITDVVEVCSTQDSTGATVCDDDDASVTIDDVSAIPALAKTAVSTGCTVDVNYMVVVSNNSEFDTLTVNALTDDKFGDITMTHAAGGGFEEVVSTTCTLPVPPISALGNFTCSFVGRIVSQTCQINHVDLVTGDVTDDDGVNSTPSDSATVTVTTTTP